MKLGYTTWGMPNVPIDQAIQHLAQLGYDGIEIVVIPGYTTDLASLDAAERKRIAGLLATHGLELTAIEGYADLMVPDATLRSQNIARIKAAIDLAVEWAQGDRPAPVIILPCGRPEDWGTQRMALADRVGAMADYAASRGVTLAMEAHIGHMVDTPYRMVAFMRMVDSPNLKANFDVSHFNVMGMSIEESVSILAQHSVHAHVKDERGRYPNHEFLIPGEGTCDYVAFLRAMQEEGYTGFVNAEISTMVQKREGYDPLAAAAQSYKVLSEAFAAAGIERPQRGASAASAPASTTAPPAEAAKETPKRGGKSQAQAPTPAPAAEAAPEGQPPAAETPATESAAPAQDAPAAEAASQEQPSA